jgi:hypothetical protein
MTWVQSCSGLVNACLIKLILPDEIRLACSLGPLLHTLRRYGPLASRICRPNITGNDTASPLSTIFDCHRRRRPPSTQKIAHIRMCIQNVHGPGYPVSRRTFLDAGQNPPGCEGSLGHFPCCLIDQDHPASEVYLGGEGPVASMTDFDSSLHSTCSYTRSPAWLR